MQHIKSLNIEIKKREDIQRNKSEYSEWRKKKTEKSEYIFEKIYY